MYKLIIPILMLSLYSCSDDNNQPQTLQEFDNKNNGITEHKIDTIVNADSSLSFVKTVYVKESVKESVKERTEREQNIEKIYNTNFESFIIESDGKIKYSPHYLYVNSGNISDHKVIKFTLNGDTYFSVLTSNTDFVLINYTKDSLEKEFYKSQIKKIAQ